jgi:murein L,D-transpeptidase YcbB/YkuD
LNPTGLVSHATLAALNVPPGQRVRQLRANMERWRWVPRNLPATRIEENTPAGFVQVYEDGQPTLGMRAVAGRPDDRTPMLQAKISSIVLNPSWRVPASIAPEIYAKGRKNKAYFAQQGFSAQPGDKVAPLIQKPGPKNALGQIKFDFDNAYGVYLHDTPGQAAFSHASRAISHGCVRLEKPVELATLLLAANADWPRDRIEAAIREGRTQRVTLKRPAPLYMFYFTAYGEGAQISFKRDIYGWDAKLLRLLDAGPIGQG